MKILREVSGLQKAVVLAAVGVAVGLFAGHSIVKAGKLQVEKDLEAALLREKKLVVAVEMKERELREQVPETIVEYIDRMVPGKTKVVEVVKWKTEEVPVDRWRVKEVVKWMGVECGADGELNWDVADDPPGSMDGTVATFETRKGNVVAHGQASAALAGTTIMSDVPFAFDATDAYRRLVKELPKKRHLVSVDYTVSPDSIFDYSIDKFISDPSFRVGYQYTLFPRKKVSIAAGGFIDSDAIGPRISVQF